MESTHSKPPSSRTAVVRLAQRGRYDRETLFAILDEGLVCHVGVTLDGQPYVIPMAYARDGERLLLHGSIASRLVRQLGDGVPACVTVTLVDGLVLARSQFHHSLNYRSVVALGRARAIEEPAAKRQGLERLVEHLVPARSADSRPASTRELAATALLEFPLDEASAKVRLGPPVDDERDLDLPHWAGVVPLELVAGRPQSAPDLAPSISVPGYVESYRRQGDRPDEGV